MENITLIVWIICGFFALFLFNIPQKIYYSIKNKSKAKKQLKESEDKEKAV